VREKREREGEREREREGEAVWALASDMCVVV
jgi:hypothetical protein